MMHSMKKSLALLAMLAPVALAPTVSRAQDPAETCATATVITTFPFTATSNNTMFVDTGDPEPTCAASNDGRGAWYQFTAPSTGTYLFTTYGSNHDTVMSLYTGSCGALTEIRCDDDGSNVDATSLLVQQMNGGDSVYILLTTYNNNPGGTLVMSIDRPHESVLLPRGNLKVAIPAGKASITKNVAIKVRNADAGEVPGHAITLSAGEDSACNLAIGAPDFDKGTAGAQNPVVVAGGKTKTANIAVTIQAANISTKSELAPTRCQLFVELVGGGQGDQSYQNNWIEVGMDVIDKNDLP